ncbi:hypothetical protein PIB30_104479 [Stylosanthes scabra]|uniref:Putative plant transposon protein domain-containing protein n=1 Tax=Stylosanthes scabra TaxID=79078 RepID=A0ABU6QZ20_9FABA|nr:hypothetical protein [Stylosanthes scabra]
MAGVHYTHIHPSSNKSEVTVATAILIHSIIKGEDVRVEELIAARIALIAQNLQHKGKLGFPSTIFKLCKEAKVPFKEFRGTEYIPESRPITSTIMKTVRGAVLVLRRHQEPEIGDQDQEMHDYVPEHEAGVDNWADNDAQYEQQQHHYYEPEQQQQPQFVSYADFQTFQQQHMAQQQQNFQSMTEMMNNIQIETLNYFEEFKNQQSSYLEELKAMKERQEELFANQNRQECYDIWAHQQANPRLAEMPAHRVTKQFYENIERKRSPFYGFLKSDYEIGTAFHRIEPPPPPSTSDQPPQQQDNPPIDLSFF